MGKENIFLGIAAIVLGVSIYFRTSKIEWASVSIIVGIALIFFYKEEDLIEGRKDK